MPGTRLSHCKLFLYGKKCTFVIGGGMTKVVNTVFYMEDDGSSISIGRDFTMEGGHIASTEGKSIIIGDDCMFSNDVEIRNGDSHPILDKETGKRTNNAALVTIGDHVWITAHVRVLKGVIIHDGSIMGDSSVVSAKFRESNSVYAGIPARLVKSNIMWERDRQKFLNHENK